MVELLKGIRVLSLNHFLMGPVGVQFLADLGADVIAIEPPEGAFQRKWGGADKSVDGQTMLLLTGNRNKRSLTLDLKKPEAIEVARKLIATSDVITENFRPGVLDKLGLGFDAAKVIKPGIIYAAASGYGADDLMSTGLARPSCSGAFRSSDDYGNARTRSARSWRLRDRSPWRGAVRRGYFGGPGQEGTNRTRLSRRCQSAVRGHRPADGIIYLLSERRTPR